MNEYIFFCNHHVNIFFQQKRVLSYKSHPIEDGGTDNPAFNHIELNFTDKSGKSDGTRL